MVPVKVFVIDTIWNSVSASTGSGFSTERFLHEARAIARLNHPHVVQLYDFGEYKGGLYLALEYIEGETLRQRASIGLLGLDDADHDAFTRLGTQRFDATGGTAAALGAVSEQKRLLLDVIARHPDRFEVVGLAARKDAALFREQVRTFQPPIAALGADDGDGWDASQTRLLLGEAGLIEVATAPDVDLVMVGTSGTAGLKPTPQTSSARRYGARDMISTARGPKRL